MFDNPLLLLDKIGIKTEFVVMADKLRCETNEMKIQEAKKEERRSRGME